MKAEVSYNKMSNSVAARSEMTVPPRSAYREVSYFRPASLYTTLGARKYVNLSERAALLAQLASLSNERRLLVLTLIWTGARISEVLALAPRSFQLENATVAIITLKRRRHAVREVPIPPSLLCELEVQFDLRSKQRDPAMASAPIWDLHRVTAWRIIKGTMERAGIFGIHATPRGLRHAFGVATLAAGVPLNIVQRLLGHSSIVTTTIYTEAQGPEARALAERFWRFSG